MRRQKSELGVDRRPPFETGPTVVSLIAALDGERGSLLAQVRRATLSLQGVEERTLYDGFCREWTPAYYVDDGQLFHVHNFRAGLRATIFVGTRMIRALLLEPNTAYERLLSAANSPGPRGPNTIKVPLTCAEEVTFLMDLVRVKRDFLRGL